LSWRYSARWTPESAGQEQGTERGLGNEERRILIASFVGEGVPVLVRDCALPYALGHPLRQGEEIEVGRLRLLRERERGR
jgi:hypothetical protein